MIPPLISEHQDEVDEVGTSSYPIITIERGDMIADGRIEHEAALAEANDVDVQVH